VPNAASGREDEEEAVYSGGDFLVVDSYECVLPNNYLVRNQSAMKAVVVPQAVSLQVEQ
jgi:hypothetical protein